MLLSVNAEIMKTTLLTILILVLFACGHEEPCAECSECGLNLNVKELSLEEAVAKSKNSTTTGVESEELKESIEKIEKKYGEQWDFCNCVVKGDSINKAFAKEGLPDAEVDRLMKRFDVIDEKCQAFRIQDANRTPEQRELHEKKVRKCLREAGVHK